MGKVFLDMAISLDGFVSALDNQDGGLHDWYFDPQGAAVTVIDELLNGIGAMIIGKRSFGNYPDNDSENSYNVPHFVLTHTAQPAVTKGGTTFTFVHTGIEDTLAQAKAAAGDKDICVAGGADVAQQFLKVGLLDEIQLHVVARLLGDGLRLFDHAVGAPVGLERIRLLESPGVVHIKYRLQR